MSLHCRLTLLMNLSIATMLLLFSSRPAVVLSLSSTRLVRRHSSSSRFTTKIQGISRCLSNRSIIRNEYQGFVRRNKGLPSRWTATYATAAPLSYPSYHNTPFRTAPLAASYLADFDNDNSNTSPFGPNSPFSIGTKINPNELVRTPLPVQPTVKTLSNDVQRTKQETSLFNNDDESQQKKKRAVNKIQLKEDLKRYRSQQSRTLSKSASTVFDDVSLDGICAALPTSKEELLEVKGISSKSVEMFGAGILAIVSMYQHTDNVYSTNTADNDIIEETAFDDEVDEPSKDKEEKERKISKTQLKKDLKQYRMNQSAPLKKPAYTIFSNAALDGIYAALPTTKEQLLYVKGIGPKKVELFGDDIIAMVSRYLGCSDGDHVDPQKAMTVPIPVLIDPASLTPEQRRAADLPFSEEKRNIFITGSAGTGKSYLLKFIVQTLRQESILNNRKVGICAPTGVAAIIVGGSTLHSYFGIGLGTGSLSSLLNKINKNSVAKKRIDETDVLIIDECSMLSSDLLETLDSVSREVRKDGNFRDKPFGGMQIIAFGDFFQLPPVHRNDGSGSDRNWRPFCFDSPVWSDLGLSENIVELKEVQRQENEEFVSLLNKVRIGEVQESDIRDLNSKCLISDTNPLPTDGIVPTRLYVLNKDVDLENISRLEELKEKEVVCKATNVWREIMPVGTLVAMKKKMMDSISMEMPDEVRLKIGAQVMLTRNKDLENKLVNGSRGVVERFVRADDGGEGVIPIVRFDCGIVTKVTPVESVRYNPEGGEGCLVRMQIPLKLAWAITIHKSQGSTLTRAMLDITSAFEYGQCYVALSRVKSLEGLWLERPAKLRNIMVSPQVVDYFHMNRKYAQ
mmetsp:Transcript_29893/g.54771  ORF Transcript_29893/g.54771 Transcript_29893/m.54771 type:complete len:852 (-) Transcript_29893:56-2611(-)